MIKKIELEIKRENGTTKLLFRVDPSIERLFATFNGAPEPDIAVSTYWKGLSFYRVPGLLEDDAYQALLREYNFVDNFGGDVYEGGKLNIAFIRTVGGKGELRITSSLSFAELGNSMRLLTQFLKKFFVEYFKAATIKGVVSIEV